MIKDYKFNINNKDVKKAQLLTSKITGKLVALLLRLNNLYYNLCIYLKEYPNNYIFEERSIRHQDVYTLIKNDSYNVNHMNYGFPDYWMLNDELVGTKDTSVEVVFRVDE